MSGYRGRPGPNLSEFLNGLNTQSYETEPYVPTDAGLDDSLAMFTNTEFTNFDLPPLSDNGEPFTFDVNAAGASPDTFYQSYNTPIQPAPPGHGYSINHSNLSTTESSPRSAGTTLNRKTDHGPSSAQSAEEQSRVAAEEDKRRRNTAASARFRVKKKQREQTLEKTVKEERDKSAQLEARVTQLEMENKWLKGLLTEKTGGQSSEEFATAYQKFRKESEEREVKSELKHGVGTD